MSLCPKCSNLGKLECDIIICSNEKCKHEWTYDEEFNKNSDNEN